MGRVRKKDREEIALEQGDRGKGRKQKRQIEKGRKEEMIGGRGNKAGIC